MPFQTGNKLWKEALKSKEENKTRLQQFFDVIVDGGITAYSEKLEDLAEGKELSKPEVDFMDRLERHLEFVAPKLARTEQTGPGGKDLPTPIINVFPNNSDSQDPKSK